MDLSFNGFGRQVATFRGNVEIGDLIAISGNGEVSKAAADAELIGVCVSKRENIVGIQLAGAATLSYSGTAPALGMSILLADKDGGIKTGSAGEKHLDVSVDTAEKTATVIL